MNKKIKIILIAAAIILVLIILWILFFNKGEKPALITLPPGGETSGIIEEVGPTPAVEIPKQGIVIVEEERPDVSNLVKLASAFAERFGSYSNQSDFNNIRDLQIFMTDSMEEWSESFIEDSRVKSGDSSIYYGITTKALKAELSEYDEAGGTAEILVKTQRREAMGDTGNAKIYYQDILIKLKKEGDIWKINGAWWQ
ncbi:MAG: hypothetical protein PHD51_02525 [Patescibacteria group bacterium]|nr:hypothetical protein [Patescibacteria group bacterium]MDD5490266.1 hypothetical protein [Patescibacteria group bacterium]